jgi:hypothetical protein
VGLLLAVLLGSGAAFVAEALDPRVEGSEALARLVGMAPIAIIPFVATQADVRRERRWRQLAVAGAMLGVAAVVVLVHFLVSPLPTLFWGLVNRLGWFL